MNKDLYNNVFAAIALNTQVIASDTDTQGNIIDTQGFDSGKIILNTGVVTLGDVTIKEINESDDAAMASETVIPSVRLEGSLTTLDASNGITELGFYTGKRYIRVEYTTDNSANLTLGSICELGSAHAASVREYK